MTMRTKRALITFIPPAAAVFVIFLKKYILLLSYSLPNCIFYRMTGFLCPGCGNTRAVRELLSAHPLNALKYNITIPLLIVFALLLYAQYVISAWIKPVRLLPTGYRFYIVIAAMLIIYFIARNFIP